MSTKGIHEHACVVEGEEVLALRPEEQGVAKAFRGYVKNPERQLGPTLVEEDWIVLCVMSGAVSVDQGGRVDRHGRKARGSL